MLKLRGFTINSLSSRLLNFHNMRSLVMTYLSTRQRDVLRVPLSRIERTSEHAVITRESEKAYKVVYDKRVLLDDGSSVPYGFL